jgi:branched-subunit amino acid transport protein
VTPAALVAFAAAGLVTFLWRFSFLALPDADQRLTPAVRRVLRHVPPAVLAALVAPAFVRHQGVVDLWDPRVLAGLVAGLVAWRFRSILGTIAAGMAVLLLANLR